MELVSIKDMPKEIKISLLKEIGYDSDGRFVIDSDGNRVKDRYVSVDIELANMLIFPGSTIILDNNPLSIALYMEEYGEFALG
ncbi:MAG: hypothetical protein V1494_07800 [Candidatus Diapherotrites archaeon]